MNIQKFKNLKSGDRIYFLEDNNVEGEYKIEHYWILNKKPVLEGDKWHLEAWELCHESSKDPPGSVVTVIQNALYDAAPSAIKKFKYISQDSQELSDYKKRIIVTMLQLNDGTFSKVSTTIAITLF